jgi:7-keto-8-aminopelargonate synthetase-like enzyme
MVRLKEKYNCEILVDEAHATGIFGEKGSGVVEEEGLSENIDFIMGTFSKAMGCFGAYLACSKVVKEFLINTCRSFIYSTSLPASVIAGNLASLDLIREEPHRRQGLLSHTLYFRRTLEGCGFSIKGESQIVPVVIGESLRTLEFSRLLQEKGYWVLPIRPPTVPAGSSRLRFSLSYYHDKETLSQLIHDLSEIRI